MGGPQACRARAEMAHLMALAADWPMFQCLYPRVNVWREAGVWSVGNDAGRGRCAWFSGAWGWTRRQEVGLVMLGSTVDLPVRVEGNRGRLAAVISDPLVLAIAVFTLAGLGLRLFYLLHGGFLLAVTEYDDGPYFGSAVRLTEGVLPYRDFVLVQPPGITLLMVPSALLAKVAGTAAGLASGRILTAVAGAASVPLAGLLVRHRGVLATVVVCGLMAVYPDAVAAAHTVLVEPWLVLFTLAGAVLVFSEDQLTASRNRLVWAGV